MELSVAPSLYGKFQSGSSTDMKVDIASPQATLADLIINDLNGQTIQHLQINEHQKKRLWVAVTPKNNGALTVTLTTEQGEAVSQSILFSSIDAPITLVSIEPENNEWQQSVDKEADESTILLISATGFPHTLQGYGAVQSIVTDLQALTALDEQQSKALGGYLAACGILLLDNASPAILARLAAKAGCGGRFVKGFSRLSDVPPLLRQLVALLPAKLPGITELNKLDLAGGHLPIVIYLSVYLLLMALLTSLTNRPALLLLFPILTSGAGLIAWYGEGKQHLIIWAETEGGDSHARYSAILSIGGDRRGLQKTICSKDSRLRREGDDSTPTRPISLDENNGDRLIPSDTALFSPAVFQLEGLLHNPQSLALNLSMVDDHPRVSNQSHIPSPPGRLVWRNRSYQVPALTPEQVWLPETPVATSHNPAVQLLSRRLSYGEAALLYPLSMDNRLIAPSATQTTGWLIIHPVSESG